MYYTTVYIIYIYIHRERERERIQKYLTSGPAEGTCGRRIPGAGGGSFLMTWRDLSSDGQVVLNPRAKMSNLSNLRLVLGSEKKLVVG